MEGHAKKHFAWKKFVVDQFLLFFFGPGLV